MFVKLSDAQQPDLSLDSQKKHSLQPQIIHVSTSSIHSSINPSIHPASQPFIH